MTQLEQDCRTIRRELLLLPVRTEIVNTDNWEEGQQSVVLSIELRDRIIRALSRPYEATSTQADEPCPVCGTYVCASKGVPANCALWGKSQTSAFGDIVGRCEAGREAVRQMAKPTRALSPSPDPDTDRLLDRLEAESDLYRPDPLSSLLDEARRALTRALSPSPDRLWDEIAFEAFLAGWSAARGVDCVSSIIAEREYHDAHCRAQDYCAALANQWKEASDERPHATR